MPGAVAWAGAGRPRTSRTTSRRRSRAAGGGGGRSLDATYVLTPLRPAGLLTLVCAWPGRGIADSRTVLDATAMVAAAAQVQVLWPDEPGEPMWPPPEPPDVPDDSWFARALNPD